jgi:hypothetical protein
MDYAILMYRNGYERIRRADVNECIGDFALFENGDQFVPFL